ncbi:MAG: ABC transporter ATP-binding protein [Vibrionaceae bacterium]
MIIFSDLHLLRGVKPLLHQASATIQPGNKVGLIGKNGCGKSSLFALLKGELQLDGGDLHIAPHWQIAWVAQETPALERSAIDYVIDGDREYRELEQQLLQAEAEKDGTKIAQLHEKMDVIDGYKVKVRAAVLLDGLGFCAEQFNWNLTQFSGGWRMRLNLAQALFCRSDLLLLDEPTNHLDLNALIWLEKWLQNYRGTLILISHDRDFLDLVVNRIIHIENQKLNEYSGNYSDFESMRAQKIMQQQAQYQKQQQQMQHMQAYIDRFRYKASKARQAQSRIKALERMEKVLPAQLDSAFNFEFRKPAALPNPILNIDKVSVGYQDHVVLDKIFLNLVPGSRIGLLGKNGAGKSTLIKLLAGQTLPFSTGTITYSQGVKIGYFAQHQLETLRDDQTPLQHLMLLAPTSSEQELRNFLGSFGFIGDQALSSIENFSGGEKARLVLALLVWQRPNLLLLDEPTNHLDLDMRTALTLALQSFEGAMVMVSHDRYLLKMSTDALYLVDNKQVTAFDGDLDDYYKWLLDSQKQQQALNNDNKATSASAQVPRKEQRQIEAQLRQKTAPLRKQIDKLEQQLDKCNAALEKIELALAEPAIYEAQNKPQLTQLLRDQAAEKGKLQEIETQWMTMQEELDEMEQQLRSQL